MKSEAPTGLEALVMQMEESDEATRLRLNRRQWFQIVYRVKEQVCKYLAVTLAMEQKANRYLAAIVGVSPTQMLKVRDGKAHLPAEALSRLEVALGAVAQFMPVSLLSEAYEEALQSRMGTLRRTVEGEKERRNYEMRHRRRR